MEVPATDKSMEQVARLVEVGQRELMKLYPRPMVGIDRNDSGKTKFIVLVSQPPLVLGAVRVNTSLPVLQSVRLVVKKGGTAHASSMKFRISSIESSHLLGRQADGPNGTFWLQSGINVYMGCLFQIISYIAIHRMSDADGPAVEPKAATKLDALSLNIQSLTKQIERREVARKEKKIKRREELNQLYDAIEEKSNLVVSKIEDLSRKPTIIIQIMKILPEIPESFPKNYHIQVVYEDVVVTGNQKFVDFDENVVDEKFILPLLSSEQARLEVWIADQQPSIYDKAAINLEADIEAALEKQHTNQLYLETCGLSVSYRVELQGIGFQAWFKNVKSLREAEEERRKTRKQAEIKYSRNKQKLEEKKNNFHNKFAEPITQSLKTHQFDLKGIEDILDTLGD